MTSLRHRRDNGPQEGVDRIGGAKDRSDIRIEDDGDGPFLHAGREAVWFGPRIVKAVFSTHMVFRSSLALTMDVILHNLDVPVGLPFLH